MALSASAIWEIRNVADFAGASDTNGGAFCTAGNTGTTGTDYTYTNINANGSAKYALTNGQTQGTAVILTASASADMIGNVAYIQGGTGAVVANRYQIINVSVGVSITVDRSTGLTAGTGTTINVGGALSTPGGLGATLALIGISTMKAYIKYSSTNYSMTVATNNVSGGILTFPVSSTYFLMGYDQTRGDRTGNKPKVSWASVAAPGSLTYIFNASTGGSYRFVNILADGNSVNNVGGFNMATARNNCQQCVAQNCNGTNGVGFGGAGSTVATTGCAALTCTTGFNAMGNLVSCYATGCTTGFLNISVAIKCLAYLNTNGFSSTSGLGIYIICTADSNTTNGFISAITWTFFGCIATNQSGGGGIGFNASVTTTMLNCFSYNNTTEISGTPYTNENMTLNAAFTGGQPYRTPGSDFRPNSITGSGLLLQNVISGMYGQIDNVDANAIQHSDLSFNSGILSGGGF